MIVASIIGGMLVLIGVGFFYPSPDSEYDSISERQSIVLSNYVDDTRVEVPEGLDFTQAAAAVIPGVVHIRSTNSSSESGNVFDDFFGSPRRGPSRSAGSGVIISDDGYIVTNNHVVEDADEILVTLFDNREYDARLIGTDPTTDLALVKISERNLPFVTYGNSDVVQPGEWVLAVGNPFNLTSTVTAGIVSAKTRNIGILRDRNNLQIESFIQTDAVVNPGNSGGALVNLRGDLIGINTAIATPTGTYAGYSFAVPVSLVKKVMDDLLEFGEVKRGLLGISITDVNAQLAESQDLDVLTGVYVSVVNNNSAAQEAGIETGDVITAINGVEVTNVSQLQELVARNRPGDEVRVTYLRSGREKTVEATLKSFSGSTELIAAESESSLDGAIFEDVDDEELDELGISGGVKITDIGNGKWKSLGVKEGFIITQIDRSKISDVEDLETTLEDKDGERINILGIYPDGTKTYYSTYW